MSRTAVLILINKWKTRCSARHTESVGWTDGREARAAGGKDSRKMVEGRRGGHEE